MSIDQAKSKIVTRIWQSIAQSGVSVSAIPKDQMQALVDAIADGVLVAIDDALAETGMPARSGGGEAAEAVLTSDEQLLWEGRPFLSIATLYQITTQRVRITTGLLGKDRDDIELVRIQDIDRTQGVTERMLNLGDIHIIGHDQSTPTAVLRNVRDPEQVHEILRQAMLKARERFRYSIQERM